MNKFIILAASAALSIYSFSANADEHKGDKKMSFEQRDADGNGTISKDEFMKSHKSSKYDKDGDGKMSEAELLEKHKERFAKMDANKDGFLTEEETDSYKEGREDKKEERKKKKEAKFEAIDTDKNGQITQEELKAHREAKKATKKGEDKVAE